MYKKKLITAMVSIAMAAVSFTGCSSENKISSNTYDAVEGIKTSSASSNAYSVVCTIFPAYDWVKEIVGDNSSNIEMTYLLDSGVDLHNYQPTTDDILKIYSCD